MVAEPCIHMPAGKVQRPAAGRDSFDFALTPDEAGQDLDGIAREPPLFASLTQYLFSRLPLARVTSRACCEN